MHDLSYNNIRAKYDCDTKIFFTDIDILVYEIETDDLYSDFYIEIKIFLMLATILKVRNSMIQKIKK